MTPNEKAHQLITEFAEYTTSVTKQITFYNAKKCAIKAVDMIIENYAFDMPLENAPTEFQLTLNFYVDVRDELNNIQLAKK